MGIPISPQAGEQFTFGSWGGEPIEWIVLDSDERAVFALSRFGLDCLPYNIHREDGRDWETSVLKAWLDGPFILRAFTDDEDSSVKSVGCLSPSHIIGWYRTLLGENMVCTPTAFAQSRGAVADRLTGGCEWWLASGGEDAAYASIVDAKGNMLGGGNYVDNAHTAVRPCAVFYLPRGE